MQQYLAALDQGTTSTRCILFDHDGRACVTAQREIAQFYPHPGWVEQDPLEIWTATLAVLRQAMTQAGIEAGQLAGIGITNQRETTLVWERATGKPVYNAIVWQCRRTAERIETLTPAQAESIRQKTGLIPDAYFSASKAEWILRHVPGAADQARRGELLFGTVDSWLLWNLTGGTLHATDETNASRTMLFDIHRRCWDEELLALFGLPAAMLPRCCLPAICMGTPRPICWARPCRWPAWRATSRPPCSANAAGKPAPRKIHTEPAAFC